MQSIRRNFLYNVIYQIFTILLPLITVPYISRVLGPEGIGIQSYTTAVSSYFILVGSLGIAAYGRRETAMLRENRKECSKVFWELTLLRGLTTGIASSCYFLIIWYSGKYSCYLMVNMIVILASAVDFTWFFQGIENFKTVVMRNMGIRILGVAALFLFIHKKQDLLLYMLILGITTLVGNLSVIPYLKRYIVKIRRDEIHILRHLKEVLVYFIPSAAVSVYTVLDKLMLGVISGSEYENGYYEQCEKIIDMTKNILFSLNIVVGARISFLYKKGMEGKIHTRIEDSLRFLMFLCIPMTLGIFGIAPIFIPWFLGESFLSCIPLLRLQSILVIVTALSNCIGGQCLTPLGRRKKSNYALCLGATVNFLLNLWMIPKWNSFGATIATIIAETFITCVYLYLGRDYYPVWFLFKVSYKYLLAGVVMLLCVLPLSVKLPATVQGCCVSVLIGGNIYIGMLILMRDSFLIHQINNLINKQKRLGGQ